MCNNLTALLIIIISTLKGPLGCSSDLDTLEQHLKGKDESSRKKAVRKLAEMAPTNPEALRILVSNLIDSKYSEREIIEQAFVFLDDESLHVLDECLDSNDTKLQYGAAVALGIIGPRSVDTIPALMKCLDSEEGAVRMKAAEALGSICQSGISVVPVLTTLLADEEPRVRVATLRALGKFGPESKSATQKWGQS